MRDATTSRVIALEAMTDIRANGALIHTLRTSSGIRPEPLQTKQFEIDPGRIARGEQLL
jgi:RNase P/RNase MRP subunit POP5